MNKGTKIRTALRVAFSIYTAFCMWQVSIGELSQQLNAPWLVGLCAAIIVLSGLVVDFLSTYYNNDYSEEACIGTGVTRQLKAEQKSNYVGDHFYTDEYENEEDYVNDEVNIDALNEEGDVDE